MKAGIVFALLAALTLSAQPVFSEEDLPKIGYQAEFVSDTSETIPVDVGTTGGPQTWDYSRTLTGIAQTFEVLDPASTEWGNLFPTAEYAYRISGVLSDTISGDMWQYLETTATQFLLLGDVYESDTFLLTHDYEPDLIQTPLPMEMGASWNTSYHTLDSLDDMGFILLERFSHTWNLVDAWGTVIVPRGSFQALRTITYDTTMLSLTFFGTPMGGDTSITIGYTWIAKDVGPVMYVTSRDEEVNPEFDTAGTYAPLFENNTAVEEEITARPFIQAAGEEVVFQVQPASLVRVSLYDASGRRLTELYYGISAGEGERLTLPRDLSRGVYFVRLQTPFRSASLKIVSTK